MKRETAEISDLFVGNALMEIQHSATIPVAYKSSNTYMP